MVTYTTENVSGLDVSSPVRYRGVSVGRVTDMRVDPRASTIEIDFEVFLDRLNTVGANVERIRQTADLRGMFPKLRAQVVGNPVTGEAYLLLDVPENPPPPIALGFTPDSAICSVDAHAVGGDAGSAAGGSGARGSDAADPQRDRLQDSRQPRPERPILHQRRAHLSGEPAARAERRLAEVLRDDEQRRLNRSRLSWTSWSAPEERLVNVRRRGAQPSIECRRSSSDDSVRARRAADQTTSRRTISGARCRPFGIRSISCASSRGMLAGAARVRGLWSTAARGETQ